MGHGEIVRHAMAWLRFGGVCAVAVGLLGCGSSETVTKTTYKETQVEFPIWWGPAGPDSNNQIAESSNPWIPVVPHIQQNPDWWLPREVAEKHPDTVYVKTKGTTKYKIKYKDAKPDSVVASVPVNIPGSTETTSGVSLTDQINLVTLGAGAVLYLIWTLLKLAFKKVTGSKSSNTVVVTQA